MNDFMSALEEYEEFQDITKNHVKEMKYLLEKINSFKEGILSIEEKLKLSIEDSIEEYDFLNKIFKNYKQEIHKSLLSFNEQITVPLNINIENFNIEVNNIIGFFNQIIIDLIESKQNVIEARENYYNYIKSNIDSKNNKEEQNEFKAKKENFAQLYKYKIKEMNEKITQNNKNYNEILEKLDNINTCSNNIVKNILFKFSKKVGNIGIIFSKLSEEINKSLNINIKKLENKRFIPQIDETSKLRFNLEVFKEYGEEKKDDINNKENEIKVNKSEKMDKSASLKNEISLSCVGFDGFEILYKPVETMNQESIEKYKSDITNTIKKLISEKELTSNEVTQLINNKEEKTKEKEENLSYIFLTKIEEFCNNRIINFKNSQNFNLLANIMNNLYLNKRDTKIINVIIELSQIIKYGNLFLFSKIQKMNQLFSTKPFWIKVIQDNLIENINNYVVQILNGNIDINKKNKKNKKENNIKINIPDKLIINIGLNKNISNYNKLDKQQKILLDKFAYEEICKILSKLIPAMSSFLLPEFEILEIINHYSTKFNFDEPTINYFQNLLGIKRIKNKISLRKDDKDSSFFLISCTLKYLSKQDLINLSILNKSMRTQIFKFLLSNENLSIEKRLEIWGIILKVKQIMNMITYKEIKQIMIDRLDKKLIIPNSQEYKNIYTIKVDLIRTPFINENKEHIEKVEWILKCLNYIKPDIGYVQGINFLALFFYQLLDYDEEKTFYYLFAFERETKYQEILKDNLKLIRLFFDILDKIIYLYSPEIYYKLIDSYISTNSYSTPWFITLFTNVNSVFEKKDAPKYTLMVIENFILDGWSAIFNSGFTLINYSFDKIMEIEEDELINFMIQDLIEQDIVKNENFHKIKDIYNKNSESINELLFSKLLKITKYENIYTFIKNKDD